MIVPKLFEAVKKDSSLQTEIPAVIELTKSNLYTAKYAELTMKEGLTSDVAAALGRMHDVVVEAAKPSLIAREIIETLSTTEALVRFPKAKLGKAKLTAELAEAFILGEKYETTDIKTDTVIRAGAEFSRKFIEDATWQVMDRQAREIGRAIGEVETEKVLSLYDGIAVGDLAGGAAINGAGTLNWAGVVSFWKAIMKETFSAKVLVINPEQLSDLWADDKFIHGFYFGEKADVARGVLGDLYLGMKIVASSKVTDGTVYAIDTDVAAIMLIRRDIMVEPFENPRHDRYGVVASERIGLGVLRSKGVARGTGW